MRVWSLIRELRSHSRWWATKPACCNYWGSCSTAREVCALQQEGLILQQEKKPCASTREAPADHNQRKPGTATKTQHSRNKKRKHSKCVDDGVTGTGIHCPTSELGREHWIGIHSWQWCGKECVLYLFKWKCILGAAQYHPIISSIDLMWYNMKTK